MKELVFEQYHEKLHLIDGPETLTRETLRDLDHSVMTIEIDDFCTGIESFTFVDFWNLDTIMLPNTLRDVTTKSFEFSKHPLRIPDMPYPIVMYKGLVLSKYILLDIVNWLHGTHYQIYEVRSIAEKSFNWQEVTKQLFFRDELVTDRLSFDYYYREQAYSLIITNAPKTLRGTIWEEHPNKNNLKFEALETLNSATDEYVDLSDFTKVRQYVAHSGLYYDSLSFKFCRSVVVLADVNEIELDFFAKFPNLIRIKVPDNTKTPTLETLREVCPKLTSIDKAPVKSMFRDYTFSGIWDLQVIDTTITLPSPYYDASLEKDTLTVRGLPFRATIKQSVLTLGENMETHLGRRTYGDQRNVVIRHIVVDCDVGDVTNSIAPSSWALESIEFNGNVEFFGQEQLNNYPRLILLKLPDDVVLSKSKDVRLNPDFKLITFGWELDADTCQGLFRLADDNKTLRDLLIELYPNEVCLNNNISFEEPEETALF